MMNTAARRAVSVASRRVQGSGKEFSTLFAATEEYPGYVISVLHSSTTAWVSPCIATLVYADLLHLVFLHRKMYYGFFLLARISYLIFKLNDSNFLCNHS